MLFRLITAILIALGKYPVIDPDCWNWDLVWEDDNNA